MNTEPVIHTATRIDLDYMVKWAAAEGWNPGLDDAAAFHAADPQGFLVAEIGGMPAACISVVRYDESFGFLGFYICHPKHRGKGIGWTIWQAGMDYLGARTVGLDGVVAQQDNYRKSGFEYAHANMRYQGRVDAGGAARGIVAIGRDLLPAIAAYDRRHFPAEREAFLQSWLFGAASRQGLALVDKGTVRGYGVIRDCIEGSKIGPLFADDEVGALTLFRALAATRPGRQIILDVPVPNEAAAALAESHGMQPVFETARMYKGEAPDLPLQSIYGITTFELG
ncbi:MAG TPA: GNAT family N-acetyltransferase [Afifellaceae bacterium]|nr:GNAT family N-acetyltransferase [Afifellaceae bacterium]